MYWVMSRALRSLHNNKGTFPSLYCRGISIFLYKFQSDLLNLTADECFAPRWMASIFLLLKTVDFDGLCCFPWSACLCLLNGTPVLSFFLQILYLLLPMLVMDFTLFSQLQNGLFFTHKQLSCLPVGLSFLTSVHR